MKQQHVEYQVVPSPQIRRLSAIMLRSLQRQPTIRAQPRSASFSHRRASWRQAQYTRRVETKEIAIAKESNVCKKGGF